MRNILSCFLVCAVTMHAYPQAAQTSQQSLSTPTLPPATGSGQVLVSTGSGTNYVAQELNANPTMVYVAKSGNDGNDGLTWQTAKLTVAAAVAALPHVGTLGSGGNHFGVIHIGPGLFTEVGNLELNAAIHYLGSQSGFVGSTGTTIQLARSANNPLFATTADYIAAAPKQGVYNHYVSLEDLALDGNYNNNTSTTAADDLVQFGGGGYNTYVKNVTFQNARRYGLYFGQGPVNFACGTCTFGNDQGGAIYVNNPAAGIATFTDTQLDNDGPDAITLHDGSGNYGGEGSYTFINLKSEGQIPGIMNHVIRHDPQVGSGFSATYPEQVTVINGWGYQNASGGGDSYAFESSVQNSGSEAHWILQNVMAIQGYSHGVFHSAKSGFTSETGVVSQFISNDTQAGLLSNAYGMKMGSNSAGTYEGPDLELSADVSISGGGNPSGVIYANPGSLFLDRTDGALWVKQSGTGNTGWIQPGQSILGNASVSGTVAATRFQETLVTPSSSTAACSAGQFEDDSNYHYVCIATNNWKRVLLSSF